MTLDEAKFWLREHNGMVAFEEIIGHYGSSEKFCNTASKENASHETWSLCHTLELSAC